MAPDRRRQFAENYRRLLDQLQETLQAAGRQLNEVTVVAVSKYVDVDETRLLAEAVAEFADVVHLGESRPQTLVEKAEHASRWTLEGGKPIRWHLIGHLQRNKARRAVETADWIHSVDSLRLLKAIARHAHETSRSPQCLLEVNISGDESKHGFAPDEMPRVVEHLADLEHPPRVVGLMAMASREGGVEQAKRDFTAARQLWDELRLQRPESFEHLSMGMSDDWPAAVAAGATIIRVGSALFA